MRGRQRRSTAKRRVARTVALVLGVVLLGGLSATSAMAATTITVNTSGDAGTGNGGCLTTPTEGSCTLRQAIDAAPSGATINFAAGLSSPITLTQGPLVNSSNQTTLTIAGPGPDTLAVSGGGTQQIFDYNDVATGGLTISGLELEDGSDVHGGAAIEYGEGALSLDHDLFLNDASKATGNGASADGGAIQDLYADGSITIRDSTFAGDTATATTNAGAGGGAIWFAASDPSTLTISGSTFYGDSATGPNGDGGAIFVDKGAATSATIANNTFDNNFATDTGGEGDGGAIYFAPSSGLTLVDDTIDLNTATTHGGGLYAAAGAVTAYGTIISGNHAPSGTSNNCNAAVNAKSLDDLEGPATTDTSCGFNHDATSDASGDPMLGALSNNGGVTPTQAITTASAAYNRDPACVETVDQRDQPRPGAGRTTCDAGAYEYQSSPPSLTVNTTADNLPTDTDCSGAAGDCSLRQAIAKATPGATITFGSGIGSTITLINGPLQVEAAGLTITGPGASSLAIDGDHNTEIIRSNGGGLTVDDLTLEDGEGAVGGGAILYEGTGTLSVDGDVFSGDDAGTGSFVRGGAIYDLSQGSLSVTNSTFEQDTATGASDAGFGGAIYLAAPAPSTLSISGSTFTGDRAGNFEAYGGAIDIDNLAAVTATIANSTIQGNSATGTVTADVSGGAIADAAMGSLTLTDDTLDGNMATGTGGAIYGAAKVTAYGTIVSGNTANNASNNCDAKVNAASKYDLEGPTDINSCGFDNDAAPVTAADPMLGTLTNNGGPTQTQAITPSSPAYGAVPSATCKSPFQTTDQRGLPRPGAGETNCDIGAYEYQASSGGGGGGGVTSTGSGSGSGSGSTSSSSSGGTTQAPVSTPPATPPASGSGTPTPGSDSATVGQTQVLGRTVQTPVTCTGSSGTSCTVTLTLSANETTNDGRLVGESARKRARTVVIGRKTITVPAGETVTVKVPLNGKGRHLLSVKPHIRARLTIVENGQTLQTKAVAVKTTRNRSKGR